MALVGYNTTVQLDNASGTLTSVGEVNGVTPFGASVNTVDTTHLTSTSGYHEYLATSSEMGEGSLTINYDPNSATDQLVRTALGDRLVRTLKVTFPDSQYFQCECFVTGWEVGEISIDDKLTATMTVKFTGAPTWG